MQKQVRTKIIAVWALCAVMLVGLCNTVIPARADSLYIIRIGLTNHLKQQESVKISTSRIALGYCVNNRFTEYLHFESASGFKVTPATGYYLISEKVYTSYASVSKALKQAKTVSASKAHTYICMAGKNKWRIYVGGITDVSKVNAWKEPLERKVKTDFGSVTSYNGQRVKIKGAKNCVLYDGADTGQYVQIVANKLNKKGSKTLTVNGYEYRGRLEIGPYGTSRLTTVNIMNVENYLRSVVGSEMDASYPSSALKAQAIASRTYAQNRCDNTGDTNITTPYQINDTAVYQKYNGYRSEYAKCVKAVTDTRGKCLYAHGEQIVAYFFPYSGGATENVTNVFGTRQDYLTSVPDIWEAQMHTRSWEYTITAQELAKMLGTGAVQEVTVDRVTESGRVAQLRVAGENKTVILKGDNIRTKLNLPSTKFKLLTKTSQETADEVSVISADKSIVKKKLTGLHVLGSGKRKTVLGNGQKIVMGKDNLNNYTAQVPAQDDAYSFLGLGEGHGVGMSQAGAKAMAANGYDYFQILKYYYGRQITIN